MLIKAIIETLFQSHVLCSVTYVKIVCWQAVASMLNDDNSRKVYEQLQHGKRLYSRVNIDKDNLTLKSEAYPC